MKFFEAVANVFRVPDLRKRLMFTLALLAVYRLGGHIPIPGIDTKAFEDFISRNQGTLFALTEAESQRLLSFLEQDGAAMRWIQAQTAD